MRKVLAEIFINGQNVTGYIEPFLESLTYTDTLDGEASTAEITLNDATRIWIGDWFPARGDTMSVNLTRANWNYAGQIEQLHLCEFEVDEIVCSYPPSKAKIKLNSIPSNSALRAVNKNRSWESAYLSRIARDVAADSNMALYYDTADDPLINRAEQDEQSNLSFLYELCKDAGLLLKVDGAKLIICDESKYENQAAVAILNYGDVAIKNFSATATVNKIYTSAKVSYKHGRKGELIEGAYTDESRGRGLTLKVNQRVESVAEAERLARKKLRAANKEEIKLTVKAIGNFVYLAGNVLTLSGHGFFDGEYIIEKAAHKIGGGYECSLELRRCLNGY